VAISPGQALAIVGAELGVTLPWSFDATQAAVLLTIRLPRALTAVLVGAGLAAAGAAMQGLFRNPLADPGLLGVTSGAAVGVAAALLGLLPGVQLLSAGAAAPLAQATLPLAAFVGGRRRRRRWWSGWRGCAGGAASRGCCWRASP
jgi:iron complex transport system permease protein